MPRTTATFSISVPPDMADEIERVRRVEHRTRSELVREALRHYIRGTSVRGVKDRIAALPEAEANPDEIEAIEEGRRQFRVGRSLIAPHVVAGRRRRARAKKS